MTLDWKHGRARLPMLWSGAFAGAAITCEALPDVHFPADPASVTSQNLAMATYWLIGLLGITLVQWRGKLASYGPPLAPIDRGYILIVALAMPPLTGLAIPYFLAGNLAHVVAALVMFISARRSGRRVMAWASIVSLIVAPLGFMASTHACATASLITAAILLATPSLERLASTTSRHKRQPRRDATTSS